ncbi:MAG: serine/threonine phosphatase [Cyanobacteria bacterium P01_H01_bin.15]
MLICPQCQFENGDTELNCERCGTSLTHQPCSQCETPVPYNLTYCPECGIFTGFMWRALILCKTPTLKQRLQEPLEYLDSAQRYQIQTPLKSLPNTPQYEQVTQVWTTTVVDLQPLQPAKLENILATVTGDDDENIDNNDSTNDALFSPEMLPEAALPYLNLQDLPAIPELQDAWIENEQQVLLISDRSDWQPIAELWSERSLPLLQLLSQLDEMAQLWDELARFDCATSLLFPSNLFIDEDQAFGLERLYLDSPEHPPAISALAELWQQLLKPEGRNTWDCLEPLFTKLASGQFHSGGHLRINLQKIAQEQAPDSSTVEETTNFLGNDDDELPTVVLPMELLSLVDVGITDIGRQRAQNEDYYGIKMDISRVESSKGQCIKAQGLYVVCDGMGGHAGGEVASALAVETLFNFFELHWTTLGLPSEKTIAQAVLAANDAIYQENLSFARSGIDRMGTTLAMILVHNTQVAIAHLGDSRVYQVTRRRGLEQITIDHAVAQREVFRGVEPEVAYSRPDAFQLTQALGPRDNAFINPDIKFTEINEDTVFLICSDGLSDNGLLDKKGNEVLSNVLSSRTNLTQVGRQLISLANQHNGHDNITVILMRLKVQPSLDQKLKL